METMLFVWAAANLASIATFFAVCGAVILGLLLFFSISHAINNEVYNKKDKYPISKTNWKVATAFALLSIFIANIIPSERTMYMMAAGYASQKMVQSEAAEKVVKIINLKLDEYLQEAEKELKK